MIPAAFGREAPPARLRAQYQFRTGAGRAKEAGSDVVWWVANRPSLSVVSPAFDWESPACAFAGLGGVLPAATQDRWSGPGNGQERDGFAGGIGDHPQEEPGA